MSLKIMIAGCAKDQRDSVESSVRTALAGRPAEEDWNVSLVLLANQWSVDIDGPEPPHKGLSLVAPADDLTASLKRALDDASNGSSVASADAAGTPAGTNGANGASSEHGEQINRHECDACQAAFDVIYNRLPGESEELCPVACPACWHVNKVPIAEAAGLTGDYRAQGVN
jgi:hypothetical protein